MKILQLNTNRSRASYNTLTALASRLQTDILLISEPNASVTTSSSWILDSRGDAALQVLHPDRLAIHGTGAGQGFAWVELTEMIIFSCYFSPSSPDAIFSSDIDTLSEELRKCRKNVLVAGDFNAKSPIWGADRTDRRGDILADAFSCLGLICLNKGNAPTFERHLSKSILDVTFCSRHIARSTLSWRVLDEETLSDHRCLALHLANFSSRSPPPQRGWIINTAGLDRLRAALGLRLSQAGRMTPRRLTQILTSACEESLSKRYRRGHPAVYWWTAEIGAARLRCIQTRRRLTRARRNSQEADLLQLAAELKEARRLMKRLIENSKQEKWRNLCAEVDSDPWGMAYKIVCDKLRKPIPILPQPVLEEAVKFLFPTHPPLYVSEIVAPEIPCFTLEELKAASSKLKTRKTPGPDGIPPEAVRLAAEVQPEKVLEAMNETLLGDYFPDDWKISRLVMLRKPGKPEGVPTSYRPLCLLNTLGKLMEQLLLQRLKAEIERTDALSENQFGFREGKSTLDAIDMVMRTVDNAATRSHRNRLIPAVVTFDIRNAFNSASWAHILQELRRLEVSPYLIRIIRRYFENRKIIAEAEDSTITLTVTSGVPQGSVLGPTLWNILYDGVLRLPQPAGIQLVAYADDLALVACYKTEEELTSNVTTAVRHIYNWLTSRGLSLAPEKTEAIILSGRRRLRQVAFDIMGTTVQPQDKLKYLGIWLDSHRSFHAHVKEAVSKAERSCASISRLLSNTSGPSQRIRQLLSTVISSVALYGAPIWQRALCIKEAKKRLERVQRRAALRTCCGYRTISTEAAFVISSIPPMELLIMERTERRAGEAKDVCRARLLARWQQRWDDNTTKAQWTKRLIPNIIQWVTRRHGDTDFHLTQVLSGHGCFEAYKHRFRIAGSNICMYCGVEDDAEHTLFHCPRWTSERSVITDTIQGLLTPANMISVMIESASNWETVRRFTTGVMKQKAADGHHLDGGGN